MQRRADSRKSDEFFVGSLILDLTHFSQEGRRRLQPHPFDGPQDPEIIYREGSEFTVCHYALFWHVSVLLDGV